MTTTTHYSENPEMPNFEECEHGNGTFYCGCGQGVSPDKCRVFFIDEPQLQKRMDIFIGRISEKERLDSNQTRFYIFKLVL